MKNPIIIFCAFTFFTSCKEKECVDVQGDLTPEERSWFSYTGGEVLIFKSNTNLTDTFQAGTMECHYNVGYSESEDPCKHHQQSCGYGILSPDILNSQHNFAISVSHHNQWNDGTAIISTQFNQFVFADFTPQNNVLINGQSYNDVYVMRIDSTNFASYQDIWRIYYTKQNGILRYDITQGQFYEKIN